MGPVLESFRFMTVTMKVTATPSMGTKDQEILRDQTPFSVAARSAGIEGGPAFAVTVLIKAPLIYL